MTLENSNVPLASLPQLLFGYPNIDNPFNDPGATVLPLNSVFPTRDAPITLAKLLANIQPNYCLPWFRAHCWARIKLLQFDR